MLRRDRRLGSDDRIRLGSTTCTVMPGSGCETGTVSMSLGSKLILQVLRPGSVHGMTKKKTVQFDDSQACRVVRGGSFDDPPEDLRSANRDDGHPCGWAVSLGFRCVRVPPALSR